MAKSVINFDFIKKRPILSGSIIIGGGLVFYFLFLSGDDAGGNAQASSGGGYADKQIVAASQVASMNHQAMLQGQQIQGEIHLAQTQANTALAIADVQSDMQKALAAISLQAVKMEFAGDIEKMMIQSDLEKYGMDRSSEIQRLNIQSELLALESNNAKEQALNQMMIQGQVNLAGLAAQVQQTGIISQENISRATIAATVNMAQLAYDTQIALGFQDLEETRIETNAELEEKRLETDASKYAAGEKSSSDKSSTWASVVIAGLSLFSDIHIKTIDSMVNVDDCLNAIKNMPVDFWRYIDGCECADDMIHLGPYAQSFYKELGATDWNTRDKISVVDYMGALTGAIKALEKRND